MANFNPRSPCGGRLRDEQQVRPAGRFQSPLSLRRATPRLQLSVGDHLLFQSTLSLRRATHHPCGMRCIKHHFNPRSPCGERPGCAGTVHRGHRISIHALLAESDGLRRKDLALRAISIHALLAESDPQAKRSACRKISNFNPRSPCGERPALRRRGCTRGAISIHALLAEAIEARVIAWLADFNPRSPCGERLAISSVHMLHIAFQSTLSLRRATIDQGCGVYEIMYFNPRSPCGERRKHNDWRLIVMAFQSTLSLRRATIRRSYGLRVRGFQSTLSLRRATTGAIRSLMQMLISIHALLAESDVRA